MKNANLLVVRLIACFLSLSLVLTSVLPLWADTVETQTAAVPQDYPPLLIGPGDLLSITVVGYDHPSGGLSSMALSNNSVDIPTEYVVDSDGKILFPFIGEVQIAGNSQTQASITVAKMLSKYIKFPQVTVLIKNSNSYDVSVLGQVGHPGKFPIRGRPTVLSILAEAGGPSENANLGSSILIHDGKKSKIDLGKYLTNTSYYQESPYVYPGDVIMVPKSDWPSVAEWAIIASIISSAVIVITYSK